MSSKNNEWKINQAEFKGYVRSKLETILARIDDLCKEHKELKGYVNEEITVNRKRIIDLEAKEKVSRAEYSIYKKIGIFFLGLIGAGIFTLIFNYIEKILSG